MTPVDIAITSDHHAAASFQHLTAALDSLAPNLIQTAMLAAGSVEKPNRADSGRIASQNVWISSLERRQLSLRIPGWD